jgi:predicted nucleic acid-binding protein
MPRYTVLLDACALVPIILADTLLRLAEKELYEVCWSKRIGEEAIRAAASVHPELPESAFRSRIDAMNAAFENAQIELRSELAGQVRLADPDDEHVLAAAVQAGANAIVTFNLKDFPLKALTPLNLEALHPDDFLLLTFELQPDVVVETIIEQAKNSRNPPRTAWELTTRLAMAGVPRFATEVQRRL